MRNTFYMINTAIFVSLFIKLFHRCLIIFTKSLVLDVSRSKTLTQASQQTQIKCFSKKRDLHYQSLSHSD